jgi:hypothetical protein
MGAGISGGRRTECGERCPIAAGELTRTDRRYDSAVSPAGRTHPVFHSSACDPDILFFPAGKRILLSGMFITIPMERRLALFPVE